MEYISTISYFLTNEMRLFLGLFLVAKVMNFRPKRMLLLLSAAGGVLVTALQIAGLPTIGVLTVELLVITAVTWYCLRDKLNLCLFLIFFYEVGVGLWDFLLQAGLGIMFHSENFINPNAMEYLAGIWLVRLLMFIGAITLVNITDLGTVLRCCLMERMGNFCCDYLRLYGVCGNGGGVSDVPERSCCAANPLGSRYFVRYYAGTPMGSGSSCSGGKHDSCGAISGLCGCL